MLSTRLSELTGQDALANLVHLLTGLHDSPLNSPSTYDTTNLPPRSSPDGVGEGQTWH
jgi:hypothetical protein